MLSVLSKIGELLLSFFNYINRFLFFELPALLSDFLDSIYKWVSLYSLKLFNSILSISIDLVDKFSSFKDGFLNDFVRYWNLMPNDALQFLTFFNIPLAITILLSALAIRFVLRLIPFVG